MSPPYWSSRVTVVLPNELRLRGYRVDELVGEASFACATFIALRGRVPSESELLLLESVLVANVDEGPTAAAALATRQAATAGSPAIGSLAAGLLALGGHTAGGVSRCLAVLDELLARVLDGEEPLEEAADAVAVEHRAMGRSIPGFGHRLHPEDRRVATLQDLGRGSELRGEHLAALQALTEALVRARDGRPLRPNVLGMSAAILGELGFAPEEAGLLVAQARLPGLVAHLREERSSFRSGRRLAPLEVRYDGAPQRAVPPGAVEDALPENSCSLEPA